MTTILAPSEWDRDESWPRLARTTLVLFVWLLPFHSLVIALLFGVAGFSASAARTIAAWKEVAVVALALATVYRTMAGRGPGSYITVPDLAIAALLCTGAISLVVANPMFRSGIPAGAEYYGFRDAVFFMLLYFVGRSTPEIARSDRLFKHLFLITIVISVVAILERIFVTPEMLVLLGVASYLTDFLGLSSHTAGNEYGLPINYWTWFGGVAVQRAGSVFMHSQGFALPFLLLMPAATAFVFNPKASRRGLLYLGYAIVWTGLLLSITRMTILLCIAQVALFFLLKRRPERALGTISFAFFAMLLTLVVMQGGLTFVWETLTFQTGSSESHLQDWSEGIVAFVQQPWGYGLGTTDSPPVRFGREPITSDNMYLSYAVQLGIVGLAALMTMFAAIMARAWRTAWDGLTEASRRFGMVIFITAIGILGNGLTSIVFSSNMLAYVFIWMAGALVTVSEAALSKSAVAKRQIRPGSLEVVIS